MHNIKNYFVHPRHMLAIDAAVLATRPALTILLVDCKENCVGYSTLGTYNKKERNCINSK